MFSSSLSLSRPFFAVHSDLLCVFFQVRNATSAAESLCAELSACAAALASAMHAMDEPALSAAIAESARLGYGDASANDPPVCGVSEVCICAWGRARVVGIVYLYGEWKDGLIYCRSTTLLVGCFQSNLATPQLWHFPSLDCNVILR